MKLRRLSLAVLLGALVVSWTGCVWLRLLAFKNQLADFDRFVKVEDGQGLTLRFVKPVLYTKDLLFLMQLEPTSRATNGGAQTWFWTFVKEDAESNAVPDNLNLTFSTSFAQDKLTAFTFSERLVTTLPQPLLLALIRAFGRAEVDQKNRSANLTLAKGDLDQDKLRDWSRLSRGAVTQMLGTPYSVSVTNSVSTCLYRYRMDSPSLKTNESLRVNARFSFSDATEALTRFEGAYADFRYSFNFQE